MSLKKNWLVSVVLLIILIAFFLISWTYFTPGKLNARESLGNPVSSIRSVGSGILSESVWEVIDEGAKPWVFWYWTNANVTKEGVTADLEAMAQQGIGGAYLFSIGPQNRRLEVEKPANPLTEYWWEVVGHAFSEAERLGLKIAMNACDGWALAAAPDITPDLSMQKLVWTETTVKGGETFTGKLKQPETLLNYYRDIAVIAYPNPLKSTRSSLELIPEFSTDIPGLDLQGFNTGKSEVVIDKSGWIEASFKDAITCRSITLFASGRFILNPDRPIEYSSDGKEWKVIAGLNSTFVGRHRDNLQGLSFSVEPVSARYFRFHFDLSHTDPSQWEMKYSTGWWSYFFSKIPSAIWIDSPVINLKDIVFEERPVIGDWRSKNGSKWGQAPIVDSDVLPDSVCVSQSDIINLTRMVSAEGELTWEAPAGHEWVIQRFGHTTTGKKNGPAGTGQGLEADKYNSAAVPVQYYSWFGNAVARLEKNRSSRVLISNHTDSWECGTQNWSTVFRGEFIKRCGYDPVVYLPAMSGVPVSSAEISERYLYDVRQTFAQLICENFYDPLVKLTHQAGARFSAESIAPMTVSDGMAHHGKVDVPMGEFWYQSPYQDKPGDIQDAVHGARVYGKNVVQAEAFTQASISWDEHPYLLKTMGDYNFALGVNRLVLHVWTHKPNDRKPGITLPNVTNTSYGIEFNRNQPWWKPGKVWFDYLSRAQSILQTGTPVIDVLYFIGENQPARALLPDALVPALPDGYTFNSINRDALLNQTIVENGTIVLPRGVTSRILVLPESKYMTPEVAQKISEFAQAGVYILGSKPDRSWSLRNYPDCDEEVKRIVQEGWGNVYENTSLEKIFEEIGLQPDIVFENTDLTMVWRALQFYKSPSFSWGHRKAENAEIYFISNQEYNSRKVQVRFSTTGKIPELWNAETSEIRDLTQWSVKDGFTSIPLEFGPAESYFIVFRKPGKPQGKQKPNFPVFNDIRSLTDSWTVRFQKGMETPDSIELKVLKSLHLCDVPEVKYYSGTAIYSTNFRIESPGSEKLYLNLGNVANLAEVYLNGKNSGIVWKPPYRLEITKHLKTGENKLEIYVSNTWRNRIAGDLLRPLDKRITWLPMFPSNWHNDLPLVESGLLGPVMIQAVR